VNPLDIYGAVAIGTGYAGVYTATSNGLLVQGNVGIGTASPNEALEVFGNISGHGQIATFANSGGDGLTVYGRASDSFAWGPLVLQNDGSTYEGGLGWGTGGVGIGVGNSLTTAMFIPNAGQVLVGYSSSQNGCCQFQVNGTIGATSTAITSLSDSRLKTHIAPLAASLPIIMALNPVSFEFVKNQMTPAGAVLAAQLGTASKHAPAINNIASKAGISPQPVRKPDVFNFPPGTQVGFVAQDERCGVNCPPARKPSPRTTCAAGCR
jgi:hypothetical protein